MSLNRNLDHQFNIKFMMLILLIVISLNIFSLAIFNYWTSTKPQIKFAIIDLAGLINSNREKWQEELIKNKSGEETQKIILDRIQKFGQKADGAVIKLQKQCACTLLIKQAVVASAVQVPDLTFVLERIISEDVK